MALIYNYYSSPFTCHTIYFTFLLGKIRTINCFRNLFWVEIVILVTNKQFLLIKKSRELFSAFILMYRNLTSLINNKLNQSYKYYYIKGSGFPFAFAKLFSSLPVLMQQGNISCFNKRLTIYKLTCYFPDIYILLSKLIFMIPIPSDINIITFKNELPQMGKYP